MAIQEDVYNAYEGIVYSTGKIGKTMFPFQKALDKAGKLRFVMLEENKLEALKSEVMSAQQDMSATGLINNQFDMSTKNYPSNKIFRIRFLKRTYNTTQNKSRLSKEELDALKDYYDDTIKLMDNLLTYGNDFSDLQEEIIKLISKTQIDKFVGLSFKSVVGDKDFITGKGLNDLYDVTNYIHGKFKKEFSKETQELLKLLEGGKFEKAGKKAKELDEAFTLPKPFTFTKLGHPLEKVLVPKTNYDYLISFYMYVDGTDFDHHSKLADTQVMEKEKGKKLVSLRQFCQHIIKKCTDKDKLPDKTELVRLGKELRKRSEITIDWRREKRTDQNKEFIDNWIDLLVLKLKNGFSPDDVVGIKEEAHAVFNRAVKSDELVKARSLRDAYIGLQHFFKQMYEAVTQSQDVLGAVVKEWKEAEKLTDYIKDDSTKSTKSLSDEWDKIKTSIENALKKYPEVDILNIIKAELSFEHNITELFYKFINKWIGSAESILNIYLYEIIRKQNNIFDLTVPEEDKFKEEKDGIKEIIKNYMEEMNSNLKETESLLKEDFESLFIRERKDF